MTTLVLRRPLAALLLMCLFVAFLWDRRVLPFWRYRVSPYFEAYANAPRWFRVVVLCLLTAACNFLPAPTQSEIASFLAGVNNKVSADLTVALKTAQTPVASAPGGIADQAAASCLAGSGGTGSVGGVIGVKNDIVPILVNATAAGGGAVTAAVVADTFNINQQPVQGWIQGLLGSDCSLLLAKNGIAIANVNAALGLIATQFAISTAAANHPVESVAFNGSALPHLYEFAAAPLGIAPKPKAVSKASFYY
jgi:hypothetical protein